MRKFFAGALAVGLGALAMGGPASADSSNAALVVKDGPGTCGVFDGYGNLVQVPYSSLENNNTGTYRCSGQVDNPTGKAIHFDQDSNPFGSAQYYCPNTGGFSMSWSQTISASGQSTTRIVCGTSR